MLRPAARRRSHWRQCSFARALPAARPLGSRRARAAAAAPRRPPPAVRRRPRGRRPARGPARRARLRPDTSSRPATAAPSAAAPAISRHSSLRLTGSTPVVGSSRISSLGSCSIARAKASFWRMPPESRPASRSRRLADARSARAVVRRGARARRRSARRPPPAKAMFSSTVRSPYRPDGAGDEADLARAAADARVPLCGRTSAGHRAQQRRLAGAVAADDDRHRAWARLDADGVERRPRAVAYRQAVDAPRHAGASPLGAPPGSVSLRELGASSLGRSSTPSADPRPPRAARAGARSRLKRSIDNVKTAEAITTARAAAARVRRSACRAPSRRGRS